jgi:purine-binding chemotaxis protein CheW
MNSDYDDKQPGSWQNILHGFNWERTIETDEVVRQRLRQRARLYAAPKQQAETTPETVHTILTFRLGSEQYGVDVMTVRSVRTISRITRVPGTPLFYRGVVNLRGQVITVMDLRLFFNIPLAEEGIPPGELVVVAGRMLEIGLLAHHVEGVQILPMSAFDPVDNMRYALGVTRERLVLLDVLRLLEDDQLVVGSHDEN